MAVRALDLLLGGLGSLLTAPLVAVLALAIRLESPGHPIYRQTRVGRDGALFEIYKLRTMVAGAEFTGAGLAVHHGDDRITRLGRVLRRFSLDELPNLWNVVRGEMSIVGPRPTVPVQVERYTRPAAPPAGGEAGDHRLGADQRTRLAAVGASGSSSISTTSSTVRCGSISRSSGGRWASSSVAAGCTAGRRAGGGTTTPAESPGTG